MIETKLKTLIRFFQKIDDKGSCWQWTGCINKDGYGMFNLNRKMMTSHRIAYRLFKDEIPKGLQVDHLCRNRSCVNPDHLELVTNQENAIRGITGMNNWQNRKTHCKRGHELKSPNLLKSGIKRGWRQCRICHNIWQVERLHKIKNGEWQPR